jgi:hypothetical protein
MRPQIAGQRCQWVIPLLWSGQRVVRSMHCSRVPSDASWAIAGKPGSAAKGLAVLEVMRDSQTQT